MASLNVFGSLPASLQLTASVAMAALFLHVTGLSLTAGTTSIPMSPDSTLALYWMHRTHNTPYREWFCDPPTAKIAPLRALVKEGNVIVPLHAIYLYVLGHAVRLYALVFPSGNGLHEVEDFFERDFFDFLPVNGGTGATSARVENTLRTVMTLTAVLISLVLFQLGVEALWPLVRGIAAYLVHAANGRKEAYAELASRRRSDASGSVDDGDEAPELIPSDPEQAERRTADTVARYGFMVGLVLILLPVSAMEMVTLHPVGLCACAILACLRLLFLDEAMLTSAENYTRDMFDLDPTKKLFEEGTVSAYPCKAAPSLICLSAATVLLAAVALLLRPCLFLLPPLLAWIVTLVYQRLHRRVLVRVKVPAGVQALEADDDGFVDIGYSTYRDWLTFQRSLCCVVACGLGVVLVTCAPFWYNKSSLFAFMNLFAPSYHAERAYYAGTNSTNEFISLTGAGEMRQACMEYTVALPQHFLCTWPTTGLLRAMEYFGVPWTRLLVWFAAHFTSDVAKAQLDANMWMIHVSLMSVALVLLVPVLVLLLYRTRRLPTSFDSPTDFMRAYVRQKDSFFQYYAAQADKQLARQRVPHKEAPFASSQSAGAAGTTSSSASPLTMTCVSQEEYVLKQTTVLLWVLLGVGVTANALLLRGGQALHLSCGIVLPAGMTVALQAMISQTRKMIPQPFAPTHNRRTYDDILAQQEERRADDQLRRKKERDDDAAAAEAADRDEPPPVPAPREKKGESPAPPLPPVPPEHQIRKTFTSHGYRYTTPSFDLAGTAWDISSQWCSPAGLGDRTDTFWCEVALFVALHVCVETYATPSTDFLSADRTVCGALALLAAGELVRGRFWSGANQATITVLFALQLAGVCAVAKGATSMLSKPSPALPTSGGIASAAAAAGEWVSGFAEAFTGPTLLYDVLFSQKDRQGTLFDYEFALWSRVYQSALCGLVLLGVSLHASSRLVSMTLESEDATFIDPEREARMIADYGKTPSEGGRPKHAASKGSSL